MNANKLDLDFINKIQSKIKSNPQREELYVIAGKYSTNKETKSHLLNVLNKDGFNTKLTLNSHGVDQLKITWDVNKIKSDFTIDTSIIKPEVIEKVDDYSDDYITNKLEEILSKYIKYNATNKDNVRKQSMYYDEKNDPKNIFLWGGDGLHFASTHEIHIGDKHPFRYEALIEIEDAINKWDKRREEFHNNDWGDPDRYVCDVEKSNNRFTIGLISGWNKIHHGKTTLRNLMNELKEKDTITKEERNHWVERHNSYYVDSVKFTKDYLKENMNNILQIDSENPDTQMEAFLKEAQAQEKSKTKKTTTVPGLK